MGKPVSRDVAAKLFRGLGDPSRLAILRALRDGPRNVSQLVEATGLTQPSASTHLSCLWCCGLVEKTKRGRFVLYRLRGREVRRILAEADRLLEREGDHVAACARYKTAPRRSGARARKAEQQWA